MRREEGMREQGRDQTRSGDHRRMMAAALYTFLKFVMGTIRTYI